MTATQQLVLKVLHEVGRPVYTTQLVKLVYFVDYIHYRHRKKTFTGLAYQWDQFGPNALSNQIVREADALARKGQVLLEPRESVTGNVGCLYRPAKDAPVPGLDAMTEIIIKDVVAKHGRKAPTVIANASKRTLPFQTAKPGDLLQLEQPNPFQPYAAIQEPTNEAELAQAGPGKSLGEIKAKYGIV